MDEYLKEEEEEEKEGKEEFYEEIALEKKIKKIINLCPVDNFRTIALNESHGYSRTGLTHQDGEIVEWEKCL